MNYSSIISLLLIFTSVQLFSQTNLQKEIGDDRNPRYGILGQIAPELEDLQWVDANGKPTSDNIKLANLEGKFKVIYCFQAWCPGCHSRGLPALKEMSTALAGNSAVEFMAIQTVFEGESSNTYSRMVDIQKQYDLNIPFGHDPGNEHSAHRSFTMNSYRTGGTPWFIFIDQTGKVVFNDYHLDTEKAIAFLKTVESL